MLLNPSSIPTSNSNGASHDKSDGIDKEFTLCHALFAENEGQLA